MAVVPAGQERAAFVSGDGEDKPRGFLDYDLVAEGSHVWGKIGYVATGADNSFGTTPVDKLIDLIYAPKTQYRQNARFVLNRKTVSVVRKLKDGEDRYIWEPNDAGGSTLYGEPIGWVQNGSWNSAHALIAGDRSAAILAVRQDISYRIFSEGVISDDSGAVILNLMQQDAVVMRATFRVAFQVANPVNREAPSAATRFPFAVLLEEGS